MTEMRKSPPQPAKPYALLKVYFSLINNSPSTIFDLLRTELPLAPFTAISTFNV